MRMGLMSRCVIACALVLTGWHTYAAADLNARYRLNVPALPIFEALKEFAAQTHLQVVYYSQVAEGAASPGAVGTLTAGDALKKILGGTGLTFQFLNDRTVAIRVSNAAPPLSVHETAVSEATKEESRGWFGRLRLAQASPSPSQREGQGEDQQTTENSQARSSPRKIELEEIVVTGTRIRGKKPVGSNLITLDRDAIEHSGQSTTAGVIQTLPQNFSGSYQETNKLRSRFGQDVAFGASVDLRGLGPDATLTLLNGRRLAPAGSGDFVDISAIPLMAVERIEVLADGASATYGSDAVAGVVNFILRRDYEGAETTVRYGNGTSGEPGEIQFGQLFGLNWEGGSLLAAYEFYRRDEMRAVDRDFAATSDLTGFGGTNFSSTQSNPGNIIQIGATPVTLAIPAGQDGTSLTAADLLSGAVNYENTQEQHDLLPRQERQSIYLTARHAFGAGFEVFGEAMYSEREAEAQSQQAGTTLIVPETNAYRVLNGLYPGQGPMRISYSLADDLGPITYRPESRAFNVVAGASFAFGGSWQGEFYGQLSRLKEAETTEGIPDTAARNAALASSDLATAFNPFGDGASTNPTVLAGLAASQSGGNDSKLWSVSLKADGPLFAMPAGDVRLAVGADYRHEEFARWRSDISAAGLAVPQSFPPPGARHASAVFAEAFVPLAESAINGLRLLELSGSVRYDDYQAIGDATTSKIGLHWSPFNGLSVKGTWGTSFKVPLFRQLLGGTGGTLAIAPASIDPNATNGSTGLLQMSGGNPNLTPEEATSWTAGIDINPPSLADLHVSATYFDVDFRDRIDTPPNVLIAFQQEENFPGLFIRNPTPAQIEAALAQLDRVGGSVGPEGIEAIYDLRLSNLAAVLVRGVDVNADYRIASRVGDFRWNLNASYLLDFTKDLGLGAAPFELVDTVFHPVDFRLRSGLAWHAGDWRVGGTINYVDDYTETESIPDRRVDAWTTFDLQIGYRLSGTQLALSLLNVTDEDPPFVNAFQSGGYDVTNASILGRFVSLTFSRDW